MELLITLVTALVALITSIVTLVKIIKTSNKIQEIHVSINSRMDELLKLTSKSSHAEGIKQELDREK